MTCLKLFAKFLGLGVKGSTRHRLDKDNIMADTGSIRNMMRKFCNAWERKNNELIPEDNQLSMAYVSKSPHSIIVLYRCSDDANELKFIEGQLADKIGLYRAGKTDKEGRKH